MEKKLPWVLVGYDIFASEGLNGLKIEAIARKVKINKSSFYHHFADIEIYIEYLLDYHVAQIKKLVEEEKACSSINPDWINVLLRYKTELLFNRQLRINRNHKELKRCFEKTTRMAESDIILVWNGFIGIHNQPELSSNLFILAIESFFFQITEDTIDFEWMENYFGLIQNTVKQMSNIR